jgi:tetratricopeptide (TPR) repeat protein
VANWLGDFTFTIHNAAIADVALRERARRLYASWVQRFEPSGELHRLRFSLAQMHFHCGDVEAGAETCRDLIEEQPSAASAYLILADAFEVVGRNGEAVELLESARAHLKDERDKQSVTAALQRLVPT